MPEGSLKKATKIIDEVKLTPQDVETYERCGIISDLDELCSLHPNG